MADLSQHTNYTARYSGLLDNFWLTLAIAGVCLVGYELEIHVPRRRGREGRFRRVPVRMGLAVMDRWKNRTKEGGKGKPLRRDEGELSEEKNGEVQDEKLLEARRRLGSRENWEFGYIYQPKSWAVNPSPPVPRWPLAWIWSSLKVRERDMPENCGLDLTLHSRFLRGCFFYTLLQTFTVLPILMPLHIIYSPSTVSKTSMLRASISSLVQSPHPTRWLWVHAVLIWWVSITWSATVLWITWGGLAYRRREIKKLAENVRAERQTKLLQAGGEEGLRGDEVEGWRTEEGCEGIKRFKTLMVTNVPPDMRDEQTLKDYFDYYIRRHRLRNLSATTTYPNTPGEKTPRPSGVSSRLEPALPPQPFSRHAKLYRKNGLSREKKDGIGAPAEFGGKGLASDAGSVAEESRLDSEVDEVVLVRKLGALDSLRSRRHDVLKKLEIAHVNLAKRVLKAVARHISHAHLLPSKEKQTDQAIDTEKGGLSVLNASREEHVSPEVTKAERMEILTKKLGPFVDDTSTERGEGDNEDGETVWDVLHSLPRELIDPYQSLTHVSSLFRKSNAPLIDYLTTKLCYLTSLLNEARSKPLASYPAASTAFVTFKDAKTARLALKILDSHPRRSLACHTAPAPEWTDLLWPRLGKSVYRSEFVRGWVVSLGVWAFTLVWIFPVSLFCAIASLSNIAGFIKPLSAFLNKNPKASSAITSLAPVILVALLTISICPILLLIANKAETVVTRLGIHNSVMSRFWKFLMVNGVVFFALGQSAIEAYLTAFQTNDFDPLPIISSAFVEKVKGHAIATGVLFFVTLIAKLIMTRALKTRFDNLDVKEADILCPPAISETDFPAPGSQEVDEREPSIFNDDGRSSAWYDTFRHSISSWAEHWGYGDKKGGEDGPNHPAHRKPIPFDHVLFSTLDRKISFDPDDHDSSSILKTPSPSKFTNSKKKPASDPARKVVLPHEVLQPWEDIPPYQRSRGYNDQPAYTDHYDDFLWLPRDPLSTLDLDDTVELRLSLTTSTGGDGRIGDWPPGSSGNEDGSMTEDGRRDDGWLEVVNSRTKTMAHDNENESPLSAVSERRLIMDQLDSARRVDIGSEVEHDEGGKPHLLRRATRGLSSLFKRSTKSKGVISKDGAISLRTLSRMNSARTVTPTPPPMGVGELKDSPLEELDLVLRPRNDASSNITFTKAEDEGLPKSSSMALSFAASALTPSTSSSSALPASHARSGSQVSHLAKSPDRLRPASAGAGGIGRSRTFSGATGRSSSAISAQQAALIDEVVKEERMASRDAREERRRAEEKEEEEVRKEEERRKEEGKKEGSGRKRGSSRGNEEDAPSSGRRMSGKE
ncbi:calcium permeable stress-gated cation channel, partial [Tremellales sp. Uapishka_1]